MGQAKSMHSKTGGARVSVTSTKAKNTFGKVLEQAMRGTPVYITKSNSPKAVLLSVEQYEALSKRDETMLASLSSEFDGLLTRMQKPGMRRAMEAAFRTSPQELGKIAVRAARKRG